MTLKYIWRSFSLGCHFHVHFSYPWHAFASHGLPAIAELLVSFVGVDKFVVFNNKTSAVLLHQPILNYSQLSLLNKLKSACLLLVYLLISFRRFQRSCFVLTDHRSEQRIGVCHRRSRKGQRGAIASPRCPKIHSIQKMCQISLFFCLEPCWDAYSGHSGVRIALKRSAPSPARQIPGHNAYIYGVFSSKRSGWTILYSMICCGWTAPDECLSCEDRMDR